MSFVPYISDERVKSFVLFVWSQHKQISRKVFKDTLLSSIGTMSYSTDGSEGPIYIDNAWLDTVVVIGITCFALCLYDLAQASCEATGCVPQAKVHVDLTTSPSTYRSPLPKWE